MKKEPFINIIKSIKRQLIRENIFGNDVQKAFIKAGETKDFHDSFGYVPPTSTFIKELLESLALEFVGEYQTFEEAYEQIDYYIYEVFYSEYFFHNNKKYKKIKYISKDGKELPISTEKDLYNSLIYEMTHKGKNTEDNKK